MDKDNYRNNAQVIVCRCCKNKKPFGIRIEECKPKEWYMTWAFAIDEKRLKGEGYENQTTINGSIYSTDEYPGCPYCGNNGFFRCGACGKITCYNGSDTTVTCSSCGRTAKIGGTISELEVGNDL